MLTNSLKIYLGTTALCTLFSIIGCLPAGADPASYGEISGPADAVSADGTVVVGVTSFAGSAHAYRLTSASNTPVDLTTLGGTSSEAYAVNADGSVVVGVSDTLGNTSQRAFRWTTSSNVMTNLGTLGGLSSIANGVNADGTVVVGLANLPGNTASHAFRWTTTAGIADLATLGGSNSGAEGVSGDGNIVVGYSELLGGATHAFMWTAASNMVDLGTIAGGTYSTATAISSDGTTVVGYGTTIGGATHATRWTAASAMTDIGTLGGSNSSAYAVNANGTVVVGVSDIVGGGQRGFRWTQGSMVSVDNWLKSQGVQLANDVTANAQGVSANGNVIVGQTLSGGGYIARGATTVPSSGGTASSPGTAATTKNGSPTIINGAAQIVPAGLMNVATYQQSLAGTPRASAAAQGADMTINGDNSSPMYALLDAGQSSAWTSGDIGRVYTQAWGGTAAVGEVGVSHSPVQGLITRIAVGRTYARQNLNQGGDSRTQGTYVLPEATLALGHKFYGTLTGYANWGNFAVRRGYTNGDGLDISTGAAGTQTYGFRARIDWLNAYRVAGTDLSPYASFTRTSTYVGRYTEVGGAFPAFFNGGTENADISRVGSDAVYPINAWLSLLGRAEYAHRFEGNGTSTTGTILGLSDFDLAGIALRQNWVRGGLGVKAAFGPGEGFLMFNASNQTAGATYWLNANYRVLF